MHESFLQVTDLVKHYGSFTALKGVSLAVAKGEAIALIGPSGSGKSTLLRCINVLETITAGSIRVDASEIGYRATGQGLKRLGETTLARQREDIGMVFQSFNLFPHMSALDNVTAGLRLVRGRDEASARQRGLELLARVGLADKAGHFPRQLSGGQQQRVAIARALAMEPKVMLFDEPTSALDPETVQEVLNVIRDVSASGMTTLIATHEMEFARRVSHRTLFMEAGQIVEHGPSEQVLGAPQTERCRKFLKGLSGLATSSNTEDLNHAH
ncbi:ATP-binding cassette domain-containing protein [Pseudomonas sp. NPDC007930]|uniref:amino acid ABC transporter ATP-binding protein n=1 Tax=Pseudomonas sp. NPDC007930 TaxID=3364417 RepID=UPI0036EA03D8